MTDLFTLEGRLALVTGSSRGLGRSLARALARAGARVIVHGRNPEIVEDARDEMSRIARQPRGSRKIVNIGSVQSVLARHGVARDPHAGRSVGRLQRARRTVAFPRLRRVLVRLGAEPRRRRRHDERRLSLAPRRASPVRGDARAVPGPGAGA